MSIRSLLGDDSPSFEPVDLGPDVLFHLVSNERRRFVIDAVSRVDGGDGVALGQLSEIVAGRENGVDPEEVTRQERKRTYVGLYQCHLPKLDDGGLVAFDSDRGVIRSTRQTHAVAAMLSHLDEEFDVALSSGGDGS